MFTFIAYFILGGVLVMEVWMYCLSVVLLKSKHMRSVLKMRDAIAKEMFKSVTEEAKSLDGMDFILLTGNGSVDLAGQTGGAFYYKYRHQVYITADLYNAIPEDILKSILAHEHCHKTHSDSGAFMEYGQYLFREIRADLISASKYGALSMLKALGFMMSININNMRAKWSNITAVEKIVMIDSFLFSAVPLCLPRILSLLIAAAFGFTKTATVRTVTTFLK